ncbi:MAG: hypothetical protein ACOYME_06255 [Prochlorotrichaceae cyanobacterium]|jgi:hypothetical protein
MVTAVIFLNGCLAIVGWMVVKKLWDIRLALAEFTQSVILIEKSCSQLLSTAPEAILSTQQKTYQLRLHYSQYQEWQGQWNQKRFIFLRWLKLFSLSQRLWHLSANSHKSSKRI